MNILNDKIKWAEIKDNYIYLYTEYPQTPTTEIHLTHPSIFSKLKPNVLYKVENNQFVEHIEAPPKDTKVLVSMSGEEYTTKRYSSGRLDKNGNLLCYTNGVTSWSTENNDVTAWEYWKLVEEV